MKSQRDMMEGAILIYINSSELGINFFSLKSKIELKIFIYEKHS